ncbi:MAG: hypothetical protein J6J86_00790, partial [Lachnospiraceae bacterium]|nr:hypothetical protein [Lachnospiraceae bacterium]
MEIKERSIAVGSVFFEVFPTLQLNPEVAELLSDVEVKKITTNK